MKKFFILEDDEERMYYFKNQLNKKYPGCKIIYADNVYAAKDLFSNIYLLILFF